MLLQAQITDIRLHLNLKNPRSVSLHFVYSQCSFCGCFQMHSFRLECVTPQTHPGSLPRPQTPIAGFREESSRMDAGRRGKERRCEEKDGKGKRREGEEEREGHKALGLSPLNKKSWQIVRSSSREATAARFSVV